MIGDVYDHLGLHFERLFGRVLPDVAQPDPVATTEASEGIVALEDGADLHPAPLQGLSLQRCYRGREGVPHVPTDEDRRRAFRDTLPVEIHNAIPWPHLQPKGEPCPQ